MWPTHHVMLRRTFAVLVALLMVLALAPTATAHWPTAHRNQSRICSGYYAMRYIPNRHYHRAVDICAARGTHIRAIASGRVIFAGWKNNQGGWQVWVRHNDGRSSIYSHMNGRPSVRYGQAVRLGRYLGTGTVLGHVGNSGGARGMRTHLHVAAFNCRTPFRCSAVSRARLYSYLMHGPYLPFRYR